MSLSVYDDILLDTTCSGLKRLRVLNEGRSHRRQEVDIPTARLSDDDLRDLQAAAVRHDDTKTRRAIEAILQSRSGSNSHVVPNFKAFESMLRDFLKSNAIDGWLYVRGQDGKLVPELVTSIDYDPGRQYAGKANPTVTIHTTYYGRSTERRGSSSVTNCRSSYGFGPGDVANQRIADALAKVDLYKETPELKADYQKCLERFQKLVAPAFSKQFRFTGKVSHYEDDDYGRRGCMETARRVVHDLDREDYAPIKNFHESDLFDRDDACVPEHPVVRCFDLRRHEFYWVHGDNLELYQYDKSLRDKLVLPDTHRDLLDVLTTDLGAFVSDIVEGKAAGNIILCKGIPGVGKTLTAEVYAELIEAPLYSIHSGTLGTNAKSINERLQNVFYYARRWNAVLLLDEADVFVLSRGDNLEQNAIVAEFLRVLEYFEGLMFLTTNRSDNIDDAIISRCAAIIGYEVPEPQHAAAIWKVMAKQFEVDLKPELIEQLLKLFPSIAPRDIKMLLRLALRVGRQHKEELHIELFRRCAMFRAIKMETK